MKTNSLSEIGFDRQKNVDRAGRRRSAPPVPPVFYTWCVRPITCILISTALSAAPPAHFAEHTVATGLTGGYQVVAGDLNHDGKIALVALASGMTELVWFENTDRKSAV